MEGSIILTMKEQRRNDVIVKLINKELNITQASKLLGVCERQVKRIKKKYLKEGVTSIIHKNKGVRTNRGYPDNLKNKILELYKTEYNGWNFYHFNDTLEDYHNIKVSNTFIYNFLTSNGIESQHKYKKRKESHPPRERKEYAGELIQVDASKHQWFDGDDSYYHLNGGIDDATGQVVSCFFTKEETTYGYQMIMKQIIESYGIPACLYTDYRTVFKSNKRELTLEEEIEGKEINNTKFANMLEHLGTDIISTMNPRAKGRIERLWRTFQDRLYKELKKKNINTIEKANEYLNNVFIPKYNSRFALPIDNTRNMFVCPLENFNYNVDLAIWSEHKVYHNSYLKYNNAYHIILDNNEKVYIPCSETLPVYTFVDGTDHLLYNDNWFDLKAINNFQIKPQQYIKVTKSIEEINLSKAHKPASNHPWVKSQLKRISQGRAIASLS